MEEEQIDENASKEVQGAGGPQSSQSSQQAQTPQQQQQGQPQAIGIETDDNMVEQAEAHGQPSNTISEWQRVHDKGYVERITEKTEKH